MKKSSFLSMVFSALLAATLVVSCDTGGGGGGGGGGSSAPSSTDIKIIIGSDSSSSDILGDFGADASDNFYYEVYFTGGGKTSDKKGGIRGTPITFPNVPFGTYEFNLDIYSDKTEAAILIGTETVKKDIQQAQNTVEFDLKYSKYQNIYFVSEADSFIKALTGRNKAGVPIDTSNMKADDESTWVRVYVNADFTIPESLVTGELSSPTGQNYYVKVVMNEKKVTSDSNIVIGDNLNIVFENGKIDIPEIQILSSSSSLTLDKIELTQAGEVSEEGAIFMVFSSGNVSIKNGSKIVATTSQPNVSVSADCTVKVEDSTIESSEGEAIFMSGGEVTLSGTTVKNVQLEGNCVYVSGGSLSVTNESQIIGDGCNAIDFEGGTLTVSDSTIKSNDMFALYLSSAYGGNPVANITSSTVTSGGDAICVPGGTLNLKNTTVTTTGIGDRGISVSCYDDDNPVVVNMDGGTVSAPNSSDAAVSIYNISDSSDNCKFVLTGGGKITGNSSGLEMDGGTFVMLGGEIEATSSDAVVLRAAVFAMTDSYAGKTATGSNRVASVRYSGEPNYLFFGGNSNVGTINWSTNSGTMLHLAQCSDISGDAGVFTTLRNVNSEFGTCNLITNLFTDETLPTGFTIMADPDEDLFGFDPDNWLWYYQEEVGASIPFSL